MDSSLNDDIATLKNSAAELQSGNERQRLELLKLARSIVTQLEKPHESIMRMLYHEPALFMATKVLGDLGIFRILATNKSPHIAEELALAVSADPPLVERLLKHVATARFVDEVGPDTYVANQKTDCLATASAKGAIDDVFQLFPVIGAIPEYLENSQYVNPANKDKTAWQYVYKTGQHYFEYVNASGREDKLEAFRNHMAFKTVGLRWFEVPELMEALFGDAKSGKDDVLLIDIGGSGGQDLLAFRKGQPTLPGRLILQDLPTTIASLQEDTFATQGVETMGHDFFTPQPIQGAKVYYLKMCLHDWPDEQCRKILAHLRAAMVPGYSKIILDEIVVPDQGADWFETSVDLLMMEVHAAQERREREWRGLIDGVEGLRLQKIWNLDGGFNKVLEIEAV